MLFPEDPYRYDPYAPYDGPLTGFRKVVAIFGAVCSTFALLCLGLVLCMFALAGLYGIVAALT